MLLPGRTTRYGKSDWVTLISRIITKAAGSGARTGPIIPRNPCSCSCCTLGRALAPRTPPHLHGSHTDTTHKHQHAAHKTPSALPQGSSDVHARAAIPAAPASTPPPSSHKPRPLKVRSKRRPLPGRQERQAAHVLKAAGPGRCVSVLRALVIGQASDHRARRAVPKPVRQLKPQGRPRVIRAASRAQHTLSAHSVGRRTPPY